MTSTQSISRRVTISIGGAGDGWGLCNDAPSKTSARPRARSTSSDHGPSKQTRKSIAATNELELSGNP